MSAETQPQPPIPRPEQPTHLPNGDEYPVAHLQLLSPHILNAGGTVRLEGNSARTIDNPAAEITDIITVDNKFRAFAPDGLQLTNHEINLIAKNQNDIRDHPKGTNYPKRGGQVEAAQAQPATPDVSQPRKRHLAAVPDQLPATYESDDDTDPDIAS